MKVSDYILILQQIQKLEGDLEVEKYGPFGDRVAAHSPLVAHRLILKGRATKQRFWATYDADEVRGEKVIRV